MGRAVAFYALWWALRWARFFRLANAALRARRPFRCSLGGAGRIRVEGHAEIPYIYTITRQP